MARGPNKGALAALGLAGLVWAYQNRDKIGAKLGEFRKQLPNATSTDTPSERRKYDGLNTPSNENQFGENYNTNL